MNPRKKSQNQKFQKEYQTRQQSPEKSERWPAKSKISKTNFKIHLDDVIIDQFKSPCPKNKSTKYQSPPTRAHTSTHAIYYLDLIQKQP